MCALGLFLSLLLFFLLVPKGNVEIELQLKFITEMAAYKFFALFVLQMFKEAFRFSFHFDGTILLHFIFELAVYKILVSFESLRILGV